MLYWRDTVASDIESYLRELQAALAGADPALVQDALFDAEEHLQAELAAVEAERGTAPAEAEASFASVVEDYGSPEEVAAAYLVAPAAGQAAEAPTATGAVTPRGAGGAGGFVPLPAAGDRAPGVSATTEVRPDGGAGSLPAAAGERPRGVWREFF
jgi:hypothetical protein